MAMLNKFKIIDDSGDHRYFTMVPNYIVNHSTAYEQAIYLYMKRKAGESGTCWTSAREMGKDLGMARNTIVINREKLAKRGWIEVVGMKGKTRPTYEYRIVDLWGLNTKFYSKKDSASDELSPRKGKKIVPHMNLDSAPREHVVEEEPSKEKPSITLVGKADDLPFEFRSYVKTMSENNQRHIRIIAIYWARKGFSFENKQQVLAAIKRELRPARALVGYSDGDIEATMDHIESLKDMPKWTLETCHKYIDEVRGGAGGSIQVPEYYKNHQARKHATVR